MRKKIIVFAGFILMTVGFSMVQCRFGGKEFHDLKSIDASLKRIVETSLFVDTIPDSHRLVLEDVHSQNNIVAIHFDSLAIEVKTNYSKGYYVFNRNFPGIQSAYAFGKTTEIYEKITDVIITSNKNYNTQYPAGSNLKDIITVGQKWSSSEYRVDVSTTIDTITKNRRVDYWYESRLIYLFNTSPETEDVHEITIKYITEKNQVFTAVIKNVKILK